MNMIIDYNAGNLTSVKRALDHLGIENCITPDPQEVSQAERIIFPGVGHAGTAMDMLHERGLDVALQEAFRRGVPILGICLGAQIVLSCSDEGNTTCLGLLPGGCPRFALDNPEHKIPHMGWNAIQVEKPHFILEDVQSGDEFYFAHSYYPQPDDETQVYATANYEKTFPAAIGYANLFATQFHPEKSGRMGLNLLKNFAQWRP